MGRKIAPQCWRRLLQLQKSKSLMDLSNQAANCHAADARQIPVPENHSCWNTFAEATLRFRRVSLKFQS
jgi:hypothetical protein